MRYEFLAAARIPRQCLGRFKSWPTTYTLAILTAPGANEFNSRPYLVLYMQQTGAATGVALLHHTNARQAWRDRAIVLQTEENRKDGEHIYLLKIKHLQDSRSDTRIN